MMTDSFDNPAGTNGFAFLEFSLPTQNKMISDFNAFGFSESGSHRQKNIRYFSQGDIHFFVNGEPDSHAMRFQEAHGPSVSAMGFRVNDAAIALKHAIEQGARVYDNAQGKAAFDLPAIYGIGDSLLYFVDPAGEAKLYKTECNIEPINVVAEQGLTYLDHVTHNLYRGNMNKWASFYEKLFNFREIRYFDIKGKLTGLLSRAMTSPCGKIRIPLNESSDDKSQIEEYLHAYKGEGIQHIALGSRNIYDTVEGMRAQGLKFLKVPDAYYKMLDARIPEHGEDLERLAKNRILMDGNAHNGEGILLQLFTPNMIGPVFFEMIERKGNQGFGEGNFKALFESMEQDQIDRGVL